MAYDEKYMQEQNHPAWRNDRMRPSSAKLGDKGCFIDDLRYAASRLYDKFIPIAETNRAMGDRKGYTMSGDTIHAVAEKLLGIKIYTTKPTTSKRIVTMRNVWITGLNNAVFSHWVTELAGGQCFDPLRKNGKFVHMLTEFRPVFIKPGVINRRYITKA